MEVVVKNKNVGISPLKLEKFVTLLEVKKLLMLLDF